MSFGASDKGGGDFEILDAGTHMAVSTQLICVGPQTTPWKVQDKVYIRFEVPAERTEIDGKDLPMIIWANYTQSLSEKANLRHDLEGWRSRPFTREELDEFDLRNILGKPCMISVVHNKSEKNGRTYANIQSISALPKGTPAPEAEGELVAFDYEHHSQAEFDALPEWLQEKVKAGIKNAAEMDTGTQQETDDPGWEDSDIPF